VAEVVGAELSLEAIFGDALRASHDAGVRNQQVKWLTLSQHLVRAGSNAGQRREIEFAELQAGVRGRGAYRIGDSLPFGEVAHGHHDFGAVSRERPRSLSSESRGSAGDENASTG
jgi:hypothetical protein